MSLWQPTLHLSTLQPEQQVTLSSPHAPAIPAPCPRQLPLLRGRKSSAKASSGTCWAGGRICWC